MIKIYLPNTSKQSIGGGWTFLNNLRNGLEGKVEFVKDWNNCDLILVMGITAVDLDELRQAKQAGKAIILRVDNVPKRSKNERLRPSPSERLRIIANGLADAVVYQSEWARRYAEPLCGEGLVIYNGVDLSIFQPDPKKQDPNNYLYAYHSRGNELKQFWLAHFYFQLEARKNPNAIFHIINNFGTEGPELLNRFNLDFWNGEKWQYHGVIDNPYEMAEMYQQCKYLIFPATVEACPNTVLEARACGCEILYPAGELEAGTRELLDPNLDISLERMCDEYLGIFSLALQN